MSTKDIDAFRTDNTNFYSVGDILGYDTERHKQYSSIYFIIPKYQRSYVWRQGTYDFSLKESKELLKKSNLKVK